LRILFDKNVPVGARRFLLNHDVHTVVEMQWPDQLENGELLKAAEESGFDVNGDLGSEYPVSAEPDGPEACLGRARVQHLADCT
jgi:hypothetical protein